MRWHIFYNDSKTIRCIRTVSVSAVFCKSSVFIFTLEILYPVHQQQWKWLPLSLLRTMCTLPIWKYHSFRLLYFLRCMQNLWWCRFCFFIYGHNVLFCIQYRMVPFDHNIQLHLVLDILMALAKVCLSLLVVVFSFLPHRLFIFNRRSCINFVFYIKSYVLR